MPSNILQYPAFSDEAADTNYQPSTPGDWSSEPNNTHDALDEVRSIAGASGLQNIVEDLSPQLGANLDGQGFAATNIGYLWIGSTTDPTPASSPLVVYSEHSFSANVEVRMANDSPTALPKLRFFKSRGELDALTALQTGDYLSDIEWLGYDGSAFAVFGRIEVQTHNIAGHTAAINLVPDPTSGVAVNVTPDGVAIAVPVTFRDASSGIAAVFDTSSLATTDKTFTFPNSSGTLMLNVVEDTTPQLGGDLDAQGNSLDSLLNLDVTGYEDISAISTPANPAVNTGRLFTRVNGNNLDLVYVTALGNECVICSETQTSPGTTGELMGILGMTYA